MNKSLGVFSWIVVALLLGSCSHDPVESNFTVVGDRAPSWYAKEQTIPFEQVQIEYAFHLSGKADVLVRWKPPKAGVIFEGNGWNEGLSPLPGRPQLEYPRFLQVGVDDMADFYEIREPGPYLHVTDDPLAR